MLDRPSRWRRVGIFVLELVIVFLVGVLLIFGVAGVMNLALPTPDDNTQVLEAISDLKADIARLEEKLDAHDKKPIKWWPREEIK